jgi:P27 family predicted phage terminase small subunit
MAGKPGRSGRKPKTALVKKLEGNRRKLGRAKLADDLAVEGAPVLPPYFDTVHTYLWRETLKALPAGLLHRADTGCLERFTVGWAQFRSVTRKILESGELVRGIDGQPVRNPLLAVQKAAASMMDRAGADLGLSPAARARIGNPVHAEDDPMSLLLAGDPDDPWSTAPWTRQ